MAWLPTARLRHVWVRNALVWRKTAAASLASNLGEPLIYLVGLGYGLGNYVGGMGQVSYLVFLAAGILASSAMNAATFEVFYGTFTRMVRQNTFLTMLAAPLGVADVVAGEILWAATKSLVAGLAILATGSLLGAFPGGEALWALPVIFLTGLVFASLGMIMTALSPSYEFFLYYFTLVTTPMHLFCGVFYPLDALPEPVRLIAQHLPLAHALALIRPLTAGTPPPDPLVHLAWLACFMLAGYGVAVRLFRRRLLV